MSPVPTHSSSRSVPPILSKVPCGVVLAGPILLAALAFANAHAIGPEERQLPGEGVASPTAPPPSSSAERDGGGITWIRVHPPGQSPCPASSVTGPGQTIEDVWCFEGANGDSTWPANPAGGAWNHWSRFDPPVPVPSRWHVTTRHGGPSTGAHNAWAGCDSLGTNPACSDVAFWVFREGYGSEWSDALTLECAGQEATAGGTIEFDLRYDTECTYDYLYLEYFDHAAGTWKPVLDAAGTAAVFNGVSGNPETGCDNGSGGSLDGNYFDTSGTQGGEPFYGNSTWYENVVFPLPAQSGDTRLRWRAESDVAWDDADGRGDTDGIGAIDNVTVTFAATGAVVTDDFETGDFQGVTATTGTASWIPGGPEGNTYDGWHLSFDPMYKNKGSTCVWGTDWMWAAKPDGGPIPPSGNGFDFFLASPAIDVGVWTGGVLYWSGYECDGWASHSDWPTVMLRTYDSARGWSPWNDINPFQILNDCRWRAGRYEDFSAFLGAPTESVQVSWRFRDLSEPGDFDWGSHSGSQLTVDDVAIGLYDATVTVFTARAVDLFTDTFSRSDPAHTSFLANAEQGNWIGTGGGRIFADVDSLSVDVIDPDGVTAGNVVLWWRHDDGGSGAFGPWQSKTMDFAAGYPPSSTDEGQYRQIVGADDGGPEDGTPGGDGRIWKAGTTVEYYVRVVDDLGRAATFPEAAATGPGSSHEFSVLPFDDTGPGQNFEKILFVDGSGGEVLDFESSTGFDPAGGTGNGAFDEPVFADGELLIRAALDRLGILVDEYDILGAGSSVAVEPRGRSDPAKGLGGYLDADGNPYYDAILWFEGTYTAGFADTTRIELAEYLDAGGKLFVFGDDVASHLGAGGGAAGVEFLARYLGTEFPSALDGATESRILNVAGTASSSLDGVVQGLYGECPFRRSHDRLTLASPVPGSLASVLLAYAQGGPGDNGRPAVIRNERTSSGGVAVLSGFDPTALLSTDARACLLDAVLGTELDLTIPNAVGCVNSGVDAPAAAAPDGLEVSELSPSPFAGHTSIRFVLPATSHVTLEIYDVLGRRVRRLEDSVLGRGVHVREWDGVDDAGRSVSGGVYFARLRAGDVTAVRKAVLLR